MEFRKKYKSYCCPYCGKVVGYTGRILAYLFGTRIHRCNFSNVKPVEEIEVEPKEIPIGGYCYSIEYINRDIKNNPTTIKTKNCPYYKHINELDGYCSLLETEIIDQVKSCSYNVD
jgi:hypothetical protein